MIILTAYSMFKLSALYIKRNNSSTRHFNVGVKKPSYLLFAIAKTQSQNICCFFRTWLKVLGLHYQNSL